MTPTVVYFIQSHRDPEQIYRVVRTLRRGSERGVIVVQHNFASCPLDWAPLADVPGTHLLPASGRQIRSHFSCQVQPYLDLIAWLEREGIAFDWLVNLTAQDYPVTPVPEIERFLGAASADAFIRYWDVLSPARPWSRQVRPRGRCGGARPHRPRAVGDGMRGRTPCAPTRRPARRPAATA